MSRLITAAIMAPLFISAVWYGNFQLFLGMVLLAAVICYTEYAAMANGAGIAVQGWRGVLAVIALILSFLVGLEAVALAAAVIFCGLLISGMFKKGGLNPTVYTVFGVFYVGLCLAPALLLRQMPDGGERLFLLLCVAVWGADIGAYYVGRAVGKHKLAPSISPGKTIEGAAGGVVVSMLSAYSFCYFIFPSAAIFLPAIAAFSGGVIGPMGDLAESSIKRTFGVKDSGTILPGHGGLLDRIDALMVALPLFYGLLYIQKLLT